MLNVVTITHLLRRHVERERPHVDLLVRVNAGNDEEDPGAAGAAGQKSTETKDDDALVLLNNLKLISICCAVFQCQTVSYIFLGGLPPPVILPTPPPPSW
jgi:hypothetical protein